MFLCCTLCCDGSEAVSKNSGNYLSIYSELIIIIFVFNR
jgi:hypothetical protein